MGEWVRRGSEGSLREEVAGESALELSGLLRSRILWWRLEDDEEEDDDDEEAEDEEEEVEDEVCTGLWDSPRWREGKDTEKGESEEGRSMLQ
jgi:hypothetical protein